jgi:hypothetical protein
MVAQVPHDLPQQSALDNPIDLLFVVREDDLLEQVGGRDVHFVLV